MVFFKCGVGRVLGESDHWAMESIIEVKDILAMTGNVFQKTEAR